MTLSDKRMEFKNHVLYFEKNVKEFIKQFLSNFTDEKDCVGNEIKYPKSVIVERMKIGAGKALIDNPQTKTNVRDGEWDTHSESPSLNKDKTEEKEPEECRAEVIKQPSETSGSDTNKLVIQGDDVCECGHRRACHSLDIGGCTSSNGNIYCRCKQFKPKSSDDVCECGHAATEHYMLKGYCAACYVHKMPECKQFKGAKA